MRFLIDYPYLFAVLFITSCATLEATLVEDDMSSSSDSDSDSDSDDGPVECDEDNAEELCGDPDLCVDGYCCDTVCDGDCDACNLPGLEGTCSLQDSSVLCREASGLCDVAEHCDGENEFCPADEILGAGDECRPAASDCDVAEYCDGVSASGCPPDEFEPVDATCGSTADDECDNPDTCDGSGTCLENQEPAGTSCGNTSSSECDNPDTCDGSGTCLENQEPAGTSCGDTSFGECDNPDTCDGSGTCQPNYMPSTTSCGSSADSICDHADTCDGSGSCDSNIEPITVECRVAVNDCDIAEFCDGAGGCPSDSIKNSGEPCGDPNDDECDNPDTCDSSMNCLLNYEPSTTSCSAASACEIADHCDGAGSCGGGGLLPPGTLCGSTLNTDCDNPDTCDSVGTCQSNYEPSAISCGSSYSDDCDNSDTCDGSGNCLDNYELTGTYCGDFSNTDCTDPDTCDGAGSCQSNHELLSTPCGSSSSTTCDSADSCDGMGTCDQNLAPPSTVCRAAVGDCDVTEYCDGVGGCPSNSFVGPGINCGSSPTACSDQDTCDGGGTCLPNHYGTSVSCGSSTTVYQCSGGSGGCLEQPQTRTVDQHCDGGGTCIPDGSVPWGNLGSACGSDYLCWASGSGAGCDLCDTLPSDYCSGGNAYHYTSNGTCSGGACSYTPTMEVCTAGCTGAGVCETCLGTIWSTNNHCYWYVSAATSWGAAEADCVVEGGHLASITSAAENTFVNGLASSSFWIGLRDNATASAALGSCDDCDECCLLSSAGGHYTGNNVTYDDWYLDCGPTGYGDSLTQINITNAGYWVFSTNGSNYDTVIEIIDGMYNSCSSTSSCLGSTSYGCDDDGGPGLNSLLRLYLNTGGYMIAIDGYNEGNWVFDARRFVNVNGDSYAWHNWGSEQPDNAGNNEDCTEVSNSSGTWNDLPCTTARPYVCEML